MLNQETTSDFGTMPNSYPKSRPRILLLHGFGGGVDEVQPLADHLTTLGYQVICPVLAGHATLGGKVNRHVLSQSKWQDWVEDAQRELDQLFDRQRSSQSMDFSDPGVVVIGFSMGGLLALQLAASQTSRQQSNDSSELRSVITINSPIYYWNLLQVAKNLSDDLLHWSLDHTRRYLRARENSPLPAMLEFLRLLQNTKRLLSQVNCPVFLLQTKDDDTVRRSSISYFLTHLGTGAKSVCLIEKGGHLVLHSDHGPEAIQCVTDYLTHNI